VPERRYAALQTPECALTAMLVVGRALAYAAAAQHRSLPSGGEPLAGGADVCGDADTRRVVLRQSAGCHRGGLARGYRARGGQYRVEMFERTNETKTPLVQKVLGGESGLIVIAGY
jgi:hypothetical protein